MPDLDPRRRVRETPWRTNLRALDAPDAALRFLASLTAAQGRGARQRLRVRPWQSMVARGLFSDPRPPVGLVSIGRGNGKSTFGAGLALAAVSVLDEPAPFVALVATAEEQARRLLRSV